ncbi:MAG: hypothetical protein U5N86_10605 [Planctomycetota bacterium]|nr:hypothetical protein [Planctomycetota bacterium]
MKGKDQDIEVNLDIDSGKLDVHAAIPCGLILNEALCKLFLNMPLVDGRKGKVNVEFHNDGNSYNLIIADDGIGISQKK